MKKLRLSLLTVLIALVASPIHADGTMAYSYDTGTGERVSWGTQKKENYDVAMRIKDASLVGKTITGVKIPLAGTDGLSGFKVWLSKELTLTTVNNVKQNAPDIASVDAVPENGELNVTFDEPYTLTEEGVYVGYSLNVDNLTDESKAPLVLAIESNADGFYLHTSRTYRKWDNKSELFGAVASITVTLSGDFYNDAAGISSLPEQGVKKGEAGTVTVTLANHGTSPVSSIDYSYEVAGLQGTGHLDLKEPIEAQYNKVGKVELTLPAITERGAYTLNLNITKVNGVDNADPTASASARLDVFSFIPVHRPLLEEYTGTWCGWCPRGFVGLELMNEKYPDLFVGVSYHNADPMEAVTQYPNMVYSFPDAWLDRVHETDAYHGDEDTDGFGIDKTYLERASIMAPAAVDVEAEWADDEQTRIDVVGTVTFAKEIESGDYRLAYILVADDLHGTGKDWDQSNYFCNSQYQPYYEESEGLEQFVYGDSYVSGLHFNDVVVLAPDLMGVEGSLPTDIEVDTPIKHNYSFTLADAVNTDGELIVQDKSKVRVVILLLDATTGEVINSNKTTIGGNTGVGIKAAQVPEGEIESVTYYDAAGRKVILPSSGLFIKSVTYKNGEVKTSKVIIK